MHIRHATPEDIADCQQITRLPGVRDYLPFVMRAQLADAAGRGSLLVAEDADGVVVGFVHYRTRRDGWSVVYDLAVNPAAQGQGVGRALLYAVPAPVRLKCTADNPANRFYANAGMTLAASETAKSGRALNVYEAQRWTILVKGRNVRLPEIARRGGMAYGVRNDYRPDAWPFMLDIEWKDYDWPEYMAMVRRFHPVMAMAADYTVPGQRALMLAQVADLRAAGVLRVLACPKFAGAVADIPDDCIVAVSVKSGYAGYEPAPKELAGRRVHLLGGSVEDQLRCIDKYHAATVGSTDGNMFTIWANYGRYWGGTAQQEVPPHVWARWRPGKNYRLMRYSARQITRTLATYTPRQVEDMPLFAHAHA